MVTWEQIDRLYQLLYAATGKTLQVYAKDDPQVSLGGYTLYVYWEVHGVKYEVGHHAPFSKPMKTLALLLNEVYTYLVTLEAESFSTGIATLDKRDQ